MRLSALQLTFLARWLGILLTLARLSGTLAEEHHSSPSPDDDTWAVEAPASEVWYAIEVAGERVGYTVVRLSAVSSENQAELSIDWAPATHVTLLTLDMWLEQTVASHSQESTAGRVLGCGWSMHDGGTGTSWQGRVEQGPFVLSDVDPSSRFDWRPKHRGLFGLEQILLERPLGAGETRQPWYLMPILNQLASAELESSGLEQLKWRDALVPTMRESVNRINRKRWLEQDDQILPRSKASLEQVYREVDQGTYLPGRLRPLPDLRLGSLIPLSGSTDGLPVAVQATYLLEWPAEDEDDWNPGPDSATQQVRRIAPGRIWLTVRRATPPPGAAWETVSVDTAAKEPTPAGTMSEARTAATAAEMISELANSVAHDERDPWRVAQALESLTFAYIENKDDSVVRGTAEEVVRTRRGDCTEHAMLLVAFCRARGLTARPVSGLVWIERHQQFGHHMWVEVRLAEDWYPLDGTRPGAVGAGHLRMVVESEDGLPTRSDLFLCTCQNSLRLQLVSLY